MPLYPSYPVPESLAGYGAQIGQTYGGPGGGAGPACVRADNLPPYNLEPGDDLTISVNGAPDDVATFTATPAEQNAGVAEPYNVDTRTLIVRVGPASEPTQTANLVGVAATAAQVAAQLNAQIAGISATDNAGTLESRTDAEGTAARYEIVGGTALGALGMVANVDQGGGNVANIDAVTAAEVASVAGAAIAPDGAGSVREGRPELCTTATGPAATIQVTGGTANPAIGFPDAVEVGDGITSVVAIRWGKSRGMLIVPPAPPPID